MTSISAQFKVYASFNFKDLSKSKLQLQLLHAKGWVPVFEVTGADFIKAFKQQCSKKKGKLK